GGEGFTAGEHGEIRSEGGRSIDAGECHVGIEAVEGVAAEADAELGRSLNNAGVAFLRLGGNSRACAPVVYPVVELVFFNHVDLEAHPGVLGAAELGALSIELTGFGGSNGEAVDVTGHYIELAAELWYPEAVDNVIGIEVEHGVAANRNN